MNTYVAFLRAINVGGRAVLSMAQLRAAFETAGCRRVRTYIQTGNVLFDAPSAATATIVKNVQSRLRKVLKGESEIMLRTIREFEALVKSDPFSACDDEPGIKMYVAFLSHAPKKKPTLPQVSQAEALETVGEQTRSLHREPSQKKRFYGFPNNFIEKELQVSATSRNWTTVTKLLEFAKKETDGPRR